MKYTRTVLAVGAASLVGCSTVPTVVPKTTGPAITFVRDTGFTGSGCTFNVLINSEVVGELKAGQVFTKRLSPGRYRASIDNASAICPNVKMTKVVEVLSDPVVLRIGITSNFQTIFDQVE